MSLPIRFWSLKIIILPSTAATATVVSVLAPWDNSVCKRCCTNKIDLTWYQVSHLVFMKFMPEPNRNSKFCWNGRARGKCKALKSVKYSKYSSLRLQCVKPIREFTERLMGLAKMLSHDDKYRYFSFWKIPMYWTKMLKAAFLKCVCVCVCKFSTHYPEMVQPRTNQKIVTVL